MKIIVPIRRVPDPDRPIRVDDNGVVQVTRWIISHLDEVAVEAAVHVDAEVIAVAFGDGSQEYLLAALARGASRGYLVDIVDPDPRTAAHALADIFRREDADLVLMGDDVETGPRLAGILGVPQATHAAGMEIADSRLRVTRKLPRSREVLELDLPAVVTVNASLNTPALLSLYAIVEARGKKVDHVTVEASSPHFSVSTAVAEPVQRMCRVVENVDELVTALRWEAHVI